MSDAARAWSALAPLIAGSSTYRMATRDGKYPRPANPPKISPSLPSRPAAVAIHAADGSVRTLCIDLDTSKAAQYVVDNDAAQITAMVENAGGRVVADHSPSGGRHLYIPLQHALPFERARRLIKALGAQFASLDPLPHMNATDGCIRPPGSVHKLGGHQLLDTPLPLAVDILTRRNPATVIDRMEAQLAPKLYLVRKDDAKTTTRPTAPSTWTPEHTTQNQRIGSGLRQVGRTGIYDTTRYATPSNARMAVLNHLAACEWTYEQVRTHLNEELAGLAALYGATAGNARDDRMGRLLAKEWEEAQRFVRRGREKQANTTPRQHTALNSDTSQPLTHRGGTSERSAQAIHSEINDIENVAYSVLDARFSKLGRRGISFKFLLRALISYARMKETLQIDVGCRSLAVALGKHHGTIAELLPQLEKASGGIVSRISQGRGKDADTYVLQLPTALAPTARAANWRKGKIHSIRPVFRALGDTSALVYEAIERRRHIVTTSDIVTTTGIGRTAVERALTTMAGLGMITRRSGTWNTTSCNLTKLAAQLDVLDAISEQISLHRKQRARWHAWLDRHTTICLEPHEIYDPEADEYWIPPGADDHQLIQSIQKAA